MYEKHTLVCMHLFSSVTHLDSGKQNKRDMTAKCTNEENCFLRNGINEKYMLLFSYCCAFCSSAGKEHLNFCINKICS